MLLERLLAGAAQGGLRRRSGRSSSEPPTGRKSRLPTWKSPISRTPSLASSNAAGQANQLEEAGRGDPHRRRITPLASETTRCLRQLGDLEQARQQAERIISLRPSHRTRSRAFGQLALASVLIAQRQPDQACDIASDVLNATQSLGSYLVISQLIQLRRQLEPYSGSAVVAEFLNCLQDTARERLAFYQLTAEGQHPHEAREGP
jgi:hypothetical protein